MSVEPYHLFRFLDQRAFRFNEREDRDADRSKEGAWVRCGASLTYSELTDKTVSD